MDDLFHDWRNLCRNSCPAWLAHGSDGLTEPEFVNNHSHIFSNRTSEWVNFPIPDNDSI